MSTDINDFPLAWRWTKPAHAVLPGPILHALQPLEPQQAERLFRHGAELLRVSTDRSKIHSATANSDATRSWLNALPWPPQARVSIAWSRSAAISLPWHAFILYWDDFCYPSSDDAFISAEDGGSVLAWTHNEVFEFAENAV